MSDPDKPLEASHPQQENPVPMFDAIDYLHSDGVGRFVNLPQLVVGCVNNPGKYAVIEAISGIGYPQRSDHDLWFITKIVLRRQLTPSIKVTVESAWWSDNDNKSQEAQRLSPLVAILANDLGESGSMIKRAIDFIRLASKPASFSENILIVEASRPEQPDLTLIDIPHMPLATSDEDLAQSFAQHILDEYLINPRNIFLTGLSAKDDSLMESESVFDFVNRLDREQKRTVAIFMHLDTIQPNSKKGRSLPELGIDIERSIQRVQSKLTKVNNPPETAQEAKEMLFHLSSAFERITGQALTGMYTDGFFATPLDDGHLKIRDPRRLRCAIRALNEDFADIMETAGCRRFIRGLNTQRVFCPQPANAYVDVRAPEYIDRSMFEGEVRLQIIQERGLELPGSFNQLLVGRLFRDQAQPWKMISRAHLMESWKCTQEFVRLLLEYLADEATAAWLIRGICNPQFDAWKEKLLEKLEELTAYHERGHPLPLRRNYSRTQPLTLEQCFPSIAQKSGDGHLLAGVQQTLPANPFQTFNTPVLKSPFGKSEPSSSESSVTAVIDQMQAYYNDALLVFRDNIAILGIENCLLSPLTGILTTRTISTIQDSQIQEVIARVSKTNHYLTNCLNKLRMAAETLKKLDTTKQTKKSAPSSHPTTLAQGLFGANTYNSANGSFENARSRGQKGMGQSAFSLVGTSKPSEQSPFPQPSTAFGITGMMSCGNIFGGQRFPSQGLFNQGFGGSTASAFNRPSPSNSTVNTLWVSSLTTTMAPDIFEPRSFYNEKDRSSKEGIPIVNRYQSIACAIPQYSPEELRVAYYENMRNFGHA
ncbi:Dynamin [Penicillium sp. DV-2018c]|nr:Dynamin [Penicillium sp. DV-2018c]KAJ5565957.1 Dynamin [Penicillium sp. DV-2018c]